MTFLVVVVTSKPTLNVQCHKGVVKIWQWIGGPWLGPLPWYNRIFVCSVTRGVLDVLFVLPFSLSSWLNNLQSGPEKIAQSLMCRYFATICSRITRFHQNAQKRAFCQSMQIYISW